MGNQTKGVLLQEFLPNPDGISRYRNLIRATAHVKRIFAKKSFINSGDLDPDDIKWAESIWWKAIQQNFDDQFTKNLVQYSPYTDETGIIRVGGRLKNGSKLDFFVKHPIILDGRHRVVRLLVQHVHEKCLHQGCETVFNLLRQEYQRCGLWLSRQSTTVNFVEHVQPCRKLLLWAIYQLFDLHQICPSLVT